MIVGFPPFYHKNQSTMYDLIEKYPVKFPDPIKHGIPISDSAKDLIERLLEKNPNKRIGYEKGVQEIIEHDWFKDIDIDKLINRQLEAPFKPKLTSDLKDVSNFDKEFTSKSLEQSIIPKKGKKKIEQYNPTFTEFDM